MKSTFIIFVILMLTACSCQDLKYQSDFGFLNSAQANSPEYLVKINGKYCKDMDGTIGLCAKRVKSDEKISFYLEKRPYSYRLNVECSSVINFNLSIDVLKDATFNFEILPEKFSEVKTFTCVGEVFPNDRSEPVSAFWHTRFVVFDKNYVAREAIYVSENKLILGQHAKYSFLNDEKSISKKTFVKSKDIRKAFTESELMRMSFYGY